MGKSVGAMKSKELAQFRNRHLGLFFNFTNYSPSLVLLKMFVFLPGLEKDTEATSVQNPFWI